jgi:hypothetical protein|nr:MAG TPA: hypothetical protein [Caudoviricetes sp.]
MKKQKSKLKLSAQRTVVPVGHLTAYLGLSRLFRFVLIVLIALSAMSCHSTKKLTQESRSDQSTELLDSEAVNISTLQMQPVKVPMSAVSLTLNLDTLRLLPLGASYTARQGQASLKVSRKPSAKTSKAGGTNEAVEPGEIIIEANCDSLELVAMQLSKTVSVLKKRLARQQHSSQSQLKEQKDTTSFSSVQVAFKWLLIGILTGFILSKIRTIFSFIKQRIYGK